MTPADFDRAAVDLDLYRRAFARCTVARRHRSADEDVPCNRCILATCHQLARVRNSSAVASTPSSVAPRRRSRRQRLSRRQATGGSTLRRKQPAPRCERGTGRRGDGNRPERRYPMRPFERDPFEKFDEQFDRTFKAAAVLSVLWVLFWVGVIVTLLILLWRNFA